MTEREGGAGEGVTQVEVVVKEEQEPKGVTEKRHTERLNHLSCCTRHNRGHKGQANAPHGLDDKKGVCG